MKNEGFKTYAIVVLIIFVIEASYYLFYAENRHLTSVDDDFTPQNEMRFKSLDVLKSCFSWVYKIIAILDVIMLMSTAVLIVQLSKKLDETEAVKFKAENKWFFVIFKICVVVLITWRISVLAYVAGEYNYSVILISDMITMFSAFMLFNILLMRDETREIIMEKNQSSDDENIALGVLA